MCVITDTAQWESVKYFNNIQCVELIEGAKGGVFAILDEECLFPKGTDQSFLEKVRCLVAFIRSVVCYCTTECIHPDK